MDLSEIRKLDKVVDRLAAAGPSGISAPHCWFCGKVGSVWFAIPVGVPGGSTCDCVKSQEAREGKRPQPKWNDKTGCIENLDAETIALNVSLGYKVRTAASVPPGKPPVPAVPGVQKGAAGISPKRREVDHAKASAWLEKAVVHAPVHANPPPVHGGVTDENIVDTDPPIVDTVDTSAVHAEPIPVHVDTAAARRAYKAEHERRRRAARKEVP